MKNKIIYCIFALWFVVIIINIYSSCYSIKSSNDTVIENKYKFTDHITRSEVTDSLGHMYYVYENEQYIMFKRIYSFSVEHRMDCKKCLDIFD